MNPARFVVEQRRWLLVMWLVVGAALIPAARRAEQTLEVSARIQGSESATVEDRLATAFGSPFARNAALVLRGVPAPDIPAGSTLLERITADLDSVPGVTQTLSYLTAEDTIFLPQDRQGTFVLVGLDPDGAPPDVLVPRLRAVTERLAPRLQQEFPGATLRWTGEAPLNFDSRRTATQEAEAAERRIFPVTLGLLLLAFGALVAAMLPVVIGALAIPLSLGAATLIAEHWPLSILLVNIVTMIGLALGIDYALLTVARFREALAAGHEGKGAAEIAARHAGHTVVLSGAAVAIGFAALLAVPVNELRSVAVGGFLVTVFTVLLATTLLPGILAMLGHRVDRGRLWRRDASAGAAMGERWRRWGTWVAAHPIRVLVVAGLPVLLLASQAARVQVELPRRDFLPPEMESARGFQDLRDMNRAGVVQSLRVVLELPAGTHALRGEGWEATRELGVQLAADPRSARVQSLPVLLRGATPNPTLLSLLPRGVLPSFVGDTGRAALVEVVP